MELFIIQAAMAAFVCSAAFYLLLTGRINENISIKNFTGDWKESLFEIK